MRITLAELQQLDKRWQKALSTLFSKYHPIFIGFAGNDSDAMDYLIQNASKFREGNEWKRSYWTVYGNEMPKGKVQEFLNESNAFLIHNNGFDDMMAKLALALHIAIPSEKDYQDQAKKQHNNLQDAFAKVQEGSKASPSDSMEDSCTTLDIPPKDAPIPPREVPDSMPGVPEMTASDALQFDRKISDTTLYLRAVVLHNDMQYQESLIMLRELIRRDPNNARYHSSCSVTLYAMKRYQEAVDAYKKSIELNPKQAMYYSDLAQTYKKLGYKKEASQMEEMAKQLQKNPPVV